MISIHLICNSGLKRGLLILVEKVCLGSIMFRINNAKIEKKVSRIFRKRIFFWVDFSKFGPVLFLSSSFK